MMTFKQETSQGKSLLQSTHFDNEIMDNNWLDFWPKAFICGNRFINFVPAGYFFDENSFFPFGKQTINFCPFHLFPSQFVQQNKILAFNIFVTKFNMCFWRYPQKIRLISMEIIAVIEVQKGRNEKNENSNYSIAQSK